MSREERIKGYLSVGAGAGNLFFQLVNARYERGAMILTSNRGFAEWGKVFGDPVVATALLDRLLHHAVVVHIEGASYRLSACRPGPRRSAPAAACQRGSQHTAQTRTSAENPGLLNRLAKNWRSKDQFLGSI